MRRFSKNNEIVKHSLSLLGEELRKIFLTFDIEDFISQNSISALKATLEILKKYDLKALFFITGHMAGKLKNSDEAINGLKEHEIGYHSSSHSVHPTIFEFTDIESYEEAYYISIKRETSHINPLTGEIEGKGGIYALKSLFPNKQIMAFRAPGQCWSPPHLEALRDIGIKYDFSANLSSSPINYKGITFYPYPIIGHWQGKLMDYSTLSTSLLKNKVTIISFHPHLLVTQHEWDLIYLKSNPKKLIEPPPKNPLETSSLFQKFDLLLKQLQKLQKVGLIEVGNNFEKVHKNLSVTKSVVDKCYKTSIRWCIAHNYKPKFLYQHFLKFFEINRRLINQNSE